MKQNKIQLNHYSHVITSVLAVILFGGFFVFTVHSAAINLGTDEVQQRVSKNILPETDTTSIVYRFSDFNKMLKPKNNEAYLDSLSKSMTSNLKLSSYEIWIDGIKRDSINRSPEVKQEVSRQIRRTRFGNLIIAILLLLLLATVRGWNRVKPGLKKLTQDQLLLYGLAQASEKAEIYRGPTNFAYRLIKSRLVLGPSYFLSRKKEDVSSFILHHEFAHLKYYDAIVRNLMVNMTSPIVMIIIGLSALASYTKITFLAPHLMPGGVSFLDLTLRTDATTLSTLVDYGAQTLTEQEVLYLFAIIVFAVTISLKFILISGFLLYGYVKLLKWFSILKEYLADEYAYQHGDKIFPEMKLAQSEYHPTEIERRSFVKGGQVKLCAFGLFLAVISLINAEGSYQVSAMGFAPMVLVALSFFLFLDYHKLKMHFVSNKQILILLILVAVYAFLAFASWDIILELNDKNLEYAKPHYRTFLYNVIILSLMVIWYGMRKRQNRQLK